MARTETKTETLEILQNLQSELKYLLTLIEELTTKVSSIDLKINQLQLGKG